MIQTVIIGATFLGCAYAYTHKDSVVVDRTYNLGNDFCGNYNATPVGKHEYSKATSEFFNLLEKNHIIDESRNVNILSTASILSQYTENSSFMLGCTVIDIKKIDDYFELTIIKESNISKICAKEVIDTTTNGFDNSFPATDRCLCAYVLSKNEKSGDNFIKLPKHNEYILKTKVQNDDFSYAHMEVYKNCEKNDLILVSFARFFMYENHHADFSNSVYTFVPSSANKSFADAFEKGVSL